MAEDPRQQQHFGKQKKYHTQIKHGILEKTLEASLSIANWLCKNNDSYIYMDLYAGMGIFGDGDTGSPLIALNLVNKFLQNNNVKFKNINFIFIDKDHKNIKSLEHQVAIFKSKNNHPKINIETKAGEWESFHDHIQNNISRDKWGFIFVDPFSTELKIQKLQKLKIGLKDIIVFINYSTLARQDGRKYETDVSRICAFLNISPEQYKNFDNDKFIELFKNSIIKNYSFFNKDFSTFAAIPVAVDGKLQSGDYFFLALLTSSLGVADAFLTEYAKIRSVSYPQTSLLADLSLEGHILQVISEHETISIYSLISSLYFNFISWKQTEEKELPIKNNIKNCLDTLSMLGKIKMSGPRDYFLKKENRKLLSTTFSNNQSMRDVVINKI